MASMGTASSGLTSTAVGRSNTVFCVLPAASSFSFNRAPCSAETCSAVGPGVNSNSCPSSSEEKCRPFSSASTTREDSAILVTWRP